MHPKFGTGSPLPSRVLALRGKLSHKELSTTLSVRLPDIPLGDPGFLSKLLLNGPQPAIEYDLAVIPHYVDQANTNVRKLSELDGVKVLDVHQEPGAFISTLAQCRYAISSSLHGLVFAEALGIPNAWIEFSDQVAGDGFKFHDWFSLARRPQKNALHIDRAWSISEILPRCQMHEMDIDCDALSNALTENANEFDFTADKKIYFHGIAECRNRPLPVFIISFNRGDYLLKSVESYRKLDREVDIIVHDNGSSDQNTLKILNDLERTGVQVFRSGPISVASELDNVNRTIDAYFANWAEPSRYVVTDCDIELSGVKGDMLTVFDDLLDTFRDVACVGPMLKIHDIPKSYALYNHAMNRHIDQFWQKEPSWFEHNGRKIAYQRAMIDTTFALYRAGESFHRLQQGLRVYYPYEANHLDWYESESAGETYRITSSPSISHWNSQEQTDAMRGEALNFSRYTRVGASDHGDLTSFEEYL
ncbi:MULTISPECIES: polysaccharide pyruvyl transferase family protein [unclassified Mesorhizobium]|uniref:polysaccharide pyruvyl transferase family protein n=1 Tax=unclassified Mesorhizobium TaxID=325217 RepID=UPI0013DE91C3|nr:MULTISPECIES: polysaccharide pyruvyl transferase family protein [unclassified Mesorhizobium]